MQLAAPFPAQPFGTLMRALKAVWHTGAAPSWTEYLRQTRD
ncbi:hypothetical protein [Celeribacter baekdonensis]|nr:hypothetical protein [Celeribacter baekdonensis]